MDEFVKLSWRKEVTDEDLDDRFLSEEAVSESYVYKSFIKPIKSKPKRNVKLHVAKEKYVPCLKYHRLIRRRSLLTKSQKSYCLEALKLFQSGKRSDLLTERDKHCLKIYSECQSKVVEENQLFQEYAKNMWLKYKDKPLRTKPGIYSFAWPKWKQKISRYLEYPQFYKEFATVCLNYDEDEATVDFQHLVQPLETGTLARFAQPNLKEQCCLKLNTLQKVAKEVLLNSKLPVSQDDNIPKLLKNHKFDAVISSSGLKQIIDYTNIKTKWIVPVVIKEIEDEDGKLRKIVFIDKVLPKVDPSPHDLNCYAYKRLLKLNFCEYEAFRYPVEETPIETDESDEQNAEQDTKEKKKVIHHNANYRIWNIKKTTNHNTLMKNQTKDSEINLLVRCKLDGCEETEQSVLYPVIVRPKIEQQMQYGVNIASQSEIARDWTSLFFRLYSFLYRARIYSPMNEVISVEKCSIQKINIEAQTHYDYKPILGLGVLEKVLSHLVGLDCGTYLLQHLPKHESFLSIMKQCDDCTENVYDLHKECENTEVNTEGRLNWLPIDVNYILPVHEEYKQIPAVFYGFDNIKETSEAMVLKMKGKKRKKKPRKKQT
ncbi:uncharacterized protein LOC123008400 isoform X2 [Tribolium madens]|uniref:uncharacterized protein LOC123008400 isoform X2 n=1 Tax=Tribolium madens TaxID=41895 RepID=UPI001CF74FB0|nr:uncharacterized protein LOC123008400 isoform X2 [Tribolium madens]